MKRLAFFILLLSGLSSSAQEDSAYNALLLSTPEMHVTDSLLIKAATWEPALLDSSSVKKWFARLLPTATNNRLRNRNYYLAGKITSNSNFNLLVLLEEKRRSDTTSVQVVHLVTTKKDGDYIASIEAAISGTKRKSNYDITSWLFNDYRIIKDSRITINDKAYDDMAYFKINSSGRFILCTNY